MGDQDQRKPAKDSILTPSEIAELDEIKATAKLHLGDSIKDVENVRSGQLSPPHTPGHTVRSR